MATLTLDSVVSRHPDLLTSLVADEIVMFDMRMGNYYGLDAVGTWIWQQLDTTRSVSALCESLEARYDVDAAHCRAEVLEFLAGLQHEGLIAVRDDAA